jgi:hypothetical protein
MDNASVKYSRAGDAFHYRWAARRCLKMLNPGSSLQCIKIEGSKAPSAAGEFVIDLAEYSKSEAGSAVAYYQLKHTTVRTHMAFTLSEIKDVISGFAKRYSTNSKKGKTTAHVEAASFHFITNRPISNRLKLCVEEIRKTPTTANKLKKDLQRITKLKGDDLSGFCQALSLTDGEGDYIVQKQKLHGEMAEFIAGFIESHEVNQLINLVSERVLPNSNGEIYREDVLNRLGATSERSLFPARPIFEKLPAVIKREQHGEILKRILTSPTPIIIHATGGVGKSVVAKQISESLPKGSAGILYDCFGGGKYRNASEPRHRAYDALTQMANEMATKGLCTLMISNPGTPLDALFRSFLERIKEALKQLRKANKKALLVLLIDAADNAEMAATEVGDQCFANKLLREPLPTNCRLVMFCRTERINLLRPQSKVHQHLLRPFSKAESIVHLRNTHPSASDKDGLEFHRLTTGNPRVQANALAFRHQSVGEVLANLGPVGTTVNEQIAEQLQSAISAIKDKQGAISSGQIDAICQGLANLPPFIPIEVLAKVSKVDVFTVQSFVSDLGRPLWHTDDAVQFRDEPTETWFRENFSARKEQIREYVSALESLAEKFTYIAKTLPQLLLKCEDYDRLVKLALSDDHLPKDSPIDERDIRVYRLQFAFKAALKINRLADAARLAFRAGEEVAGNKRQLELLQSNVDLIEPLQDAHRVQELAYQQLFRCAWQGSENLYSASLLSSVKDFRGEARSYLRSAKKWLQIYFEERDKRKKNDPDHFNHQEQLQHSDIAEFAWTHHNLNDAATTVKYIIGWRPPEIVFKVTKILVSRLIDAARFDEVNKIARLGANNPYVIIAVADELIAGAKFPAKQSLLRILNLLTSKKTQIPRPQALSHDDAITPAIISFAEACSAKKLPRKKIQTLLEFYTSGTADRSITSDFFSNPRRTVFRGIALREVLRGNFKPETKKLLPQQPAKEKRHRTDEEDERKMIQVIDALLPLYILRARLIVKDREALNADNSELVARFESGYEHGYGSVNDRLPYEVSRLRFEFLALKANVSEQELNNFTLKVINNDKAKLTLGDRLAATHAAFRLSHLAPIRGSLDQSCSRIIASIDSDGPQERSGSYVDLARAVLPISKADAAAYFSDAVEAVSKFGDEMLDRWAALVAVAKRGVGASNCTPELAYRFVRCGEVIGENVVREKYWDRDEVFRVALHLCPSEAFAALSRWQDRDVGWFGSQLRVLASEAIKTGEINSSVGWGLTGFRGCNHSGRYAAVCIRHETDKSKQQRLLDAAVFDCEHFENPSEHWEQLESVKALEAVASEFKLQSERLNKLIVAREKANSRTETIAAIQIVSNTAPQPAPNWNKIFQRADLLTPGGVSKVINSHNAMPPPLSVSEFWQELFLRAPVGKESEFLKVLVEAEALDVFDIGRSLNSIPSNWKNKAAVQRYWPSFMRAIGKRHGHALTSRDSLSYWKQSYNLSEGDIQFLREGMVQGLAESSELAEAAEFFSFISNVLKQLTTDEAGALLEYALSRFELHIGDDFGDGPWRNWLIVSDDLSDAVGGLIWSSLGSPHADIRWEAAHCVRRLADYFCAAEINSLLRWMQKDTIGAFGSNRFQFYNLHAKLYLLIALARVAVDDTKILQPHSKCFAEIALEGLPHILIQKTAAEIALSIERNAPGSYSAEQVAKLKQVGKSPFPIKQIDDRAKNLNTPWHIKGEVDRTLKVHFGYDFDRYWFPPLGRVFAVSEEQVIELACEAACKYLNIPSGDNYIKDPRQQQWNTLERRQRGRTTWASHGSYPHIDNYSFYYSYHALLSVAARLISSMPAIQIWNREYDEERWDDWLRHHSLSRNDGKWLSDRHDPYPLIRREWTKQQPQRDWLWGVSADDFLDALLHQNTLPQSLCVHGSWSDCKGDFWETINIESALVSSETSNSLAVALRTSEDSFSCYLPTGSNDESKSVSSLFELAEWIRDIDNGGNGLDRFDPYAAEINYPPDEVEQAFATLLGLSADSEKREWRLPGAQSPSVNCEIWNELKNTDLDAPSRSGKRMSASIDILKALCTKTGKEIIFLVKIERHESRRYNSANEDGFGYIPPSHKVFIFSSNGILRDTAKSHKLG